ncbi:MAG: branched-chain amino acid ABC transporter permease, partial [Anaerolineae bacterium]|nr:branched-chain amino acid ABC transporter permease [Anaerolineae bacterium]
MLRPSGIYDVKYEQDMAIYRTRVDWFWGAVILAALFILPLLTREGPFFDQGLVSVSVLSTFTRIGIFIIVVTGLNLLMGYTGQISLGQAAFVMVGAYTSQVLVAQKDVPFWLALPISALFTGLIGLIFGIPSLRVRGFYLAMATLAAQFIIPWFIKSYEGTWFESSFWESTGFIGDFFRSIDLGGATGKSVPAPELFGTRFNNDLSMYYVVLV